MAQICIERFFWTGVILASLTQPGLAQGTNQKNSAYSIDGPGGGVSTPRSSAADRPVPPAVVANPYRYQRYIEQPNKPKR
jgi:hypothetical protein